MNDTVDPSVSIITQTRWVDLLNPGVRTYDNTQILIGQPAGRHSMKGIYPCIERKCKDLACDPCQYR